MGEVEIWMPLYCADSLANTARLTTRQFGAYVLLMIKCWRNGPLPNNDGILRQITHLEKSQWKLDGPALKAYFPEDPDGKLHNERMDELKMTALENRRMAKERSEKANAARWGRESTGTALSNARSIPLRTSKGPLERSSSPPTSKTASTKAGTDNEGPLADVHDNTAKSLSGDRTTPPLQHAIAMFERLHIPAGDTLVRIAAEAIRFNAIEFGLSEEESTTSIERAARETQGRGDTLKRWWFEDCKYKSGNQTHRSGGLQPDRSNAKDGKARKDEIVRHLEFCARELKGKSAEVSGLQTIAEELGALAESLHGSALGRDEAEIDTALTAMEKRMFSLVGSATDQERITEIGKKARAEFGKRREMNAEQLRDIERQVIFKRLLEAIDLPRLSLFYMNSNQQMRAANRSCAKAKE